MATLAKQQIFDRVARHLLKQGALSMDSDRCAYRGDGGRRCAAGCLIPDNVYSAAIEGANIPDDIDDFDDADDETMALVQVLFESDLPPETWGLLRDLQSVHDNGEPDTWPSGLHAVADDHSLSPAVLDLAP